MVFSLRLKKYGGAVSPQQIQQNSSVAVDNRVNSVNSPTGNQPLAVHPFFQSHSVSNVVPSNQNFISYSRAPLNSRVKMGGAIDAGLFNIDFNKSKSNKKKVFLNFK